MLPQQWYVPFSRRSCCSVNPWCSSPGFPPPLPKLGSSASFFCSLLGCFWLLLLYFCLLLFLPLGRGNFWYSQRSSGQRTQLARVNLIVHSRCCPNCPNHPHLELPHSRSEPHLTSGLAPPSLSRASCWVCVCSWAPACGFWGLVCCCCGTWSWLQLPPVVFGAMGMCPITEGGHPLPLGAFPARTASSAPRCSGDTSLQPAGEF